MTHLTRRDLLRIWGHLGTLIDKYNLNAMLAEDSNDNDDIIRYNQIINELRQLQDLIDAEISTQLQEKDRA